MVAYSFKRRFEGPIMAGEKRQTIRGDRKRHARPGEELQLYTGMRTRQCRLLGRTVCIDVLPVTLFFSDASPGRDGVIVQGVHFRDFNQFARLDGFASWIEMKSFWAKNHPGVDEFDGFLIRWGDLL